MIAGSIPFSKCNSRLDRTRLERSLVPLYHLWAQSYCLSSERKLAVKLMEYVVERRRRKHDERDANRLAAEHLLVIANRDIGQTQRRQRCWTMWSRWPRHHRQRVDDRYMSLASILAVNILSQIESFVE